MNYEKLLRRLRQKLFTYDDVQQDKCAELIKKVKARCRFEPTHNEERYQQEYFRHM
jgi:hypothetical protein